MVKGLFFLNYVASKAEDLLFTVGASDYTRLMDQKGRGGGLASAGKLHFLRLPHHHSSCIRIYTFLQQYKNCSYVTVSTPLSRVVDLMHCADGFTFPLTCQSEKPSERKA